MRTRTRTWRLTPAAMVLMVLLVLLPIFGFVLHGLAGTLAWVLLFIVIALLIGPAISPRTSTWEGPYRDRRLH